MCSRIDLQCRSTLMEHLITAYLNTRPYTSVEGIPQIIPTFLLTLVLINRSISF